MKNVQVKSWSLEATGGIKPGKSWGSHEHCLQECEELNHGSIVPATPGTGWTHWQMYGGTSSLSVRTSWAKAVGHQACCSGWQFSCHGSAVPRGPHQGRLQGGQTAGSQNLRLYRILDYAHEHTTWFVYKGRCLPVIILGDSGGKFEESGSAFVFTQCFPQAKSP